MNTSRHSKQPHPPTSPSQDGKVRELSPETIENLIAVQKTKVENDAKSLAIKDKELAGNIELAKAAMEHDAQIAKKAPAEHRKTILYYGAITFAFTILLLCFLGYCLHLGKESFVVDTLKVILYPAVTAGGYYVGRKSKSKKEKSPSAQIGDADIIDQH